MSKSEYNVVVDDKPPSVAITHDALQRVRAFIAGCPVEINGFGEVVPYGERGLLITDTFITPQTATPGSVDIADADFHAFLYELRQTGRDRTRIRFQWHSHVNMSAYFSGTDLGTIYGYQGTTDWMVSLVMNRRGEYSCRFDQFEPLRRAFDLELDVVIGQPDDDVMAECLEDIEEKVTIHRQPFHRVLRATKRALVGDPHMFDPVNRVDDAETVLEALESVTDAEEEAALWTS